MTPRSVTAAASSGPLTTFIPAERTRIRISNLSPHTQVAKLDAKCVPGARLGILNNLVAGGRNYGYDPDKVKERPNGMVGS